MPDKVNSILEILNLSSEYLEEKEVIEPRLSSELIISHVLNIKRLDIYLQFERILTNEELAEIRILLSRRSKHEPLQYIFSEAEFYGLKFIVDNSVLIPRFDTEILVEEAVSIVGNRSMKILEIGTGSGCIAVALAKMCENVNITATDISEKAINIAAQNAKINRVEDKIQFFKHNILNDSISGTYDLIISNPPYIKKDIINTLELQVKKFEPTIALTDNNDGLTFYKRISLIVTEILRPEGSVVIEIGFDQTDEVKRIFRNKFTRIKVKKDLSGNDRVMIMSK